MKELIKKAFKDKEFVELFKEYCLKSQEFSDYLLWHHDQLSNKLLDKYRNNWIGGVVIECMEDNELMDLAVGGLKSL